MREIRTSGSEGEGALSGSPYLGVAEIAFRSRIRSAERAS